MQILSEVDPTPEQLTLISRNKTGIEIIRGAAGSGKTTTALLRLRSLIGLVRSRKRREGDDDEPVRVLVLTYNRTLRGYISELARHKANYPDVSCEVSTFALWALNKLQPIDLLNNDKRHTKIKSLGAHINMDLDFLVDEVEYVMGRFLPENLDDYLTARRDGRGTFPRIERPMREQILNEVIKPYQTEIDDEGLWDWNDLAVFFSKRQVDVCYDIIIADEVQDFSANQLRAIKNQLSENGNLVFVIDTAQRIYARGYTWQEVGISVRPEQVHRLKLNYRNTKQIAAFAQPLVNSIPKDDDATLPDFSDSSREGELPLVIKGKYSKQVSYCINRIKTSVDLNVESVAFLHPSGGGWFNYLRSALGRENIRFVDITRKSEWPAGDENVALSTIHSAKGLEFDHVFILGLSYEVTPNGMDDNDDRLLVFRRLLAMGIGRARKSLIIGYKPSEESQLTQYLDQSTYCEVVL